MTTDKEAEFTLIAEALSKLEEIDEPGNGAQVGEIRSQLIRALAEADMESNRDIYDELAEE